MTETCTFSKFIALHQSSRSRPMTPSKPLAHWCADITFMTNAEDQHLFSLLTCVDVFSKFAWAQIIQSGTAKYTSKTVADAMGSIQE